ncbi:MAG: hypothetical protein APR54_07920, partial [Candidatus Cloacimonas sp. SDB]
FIITSLSLISATYYPDFKRHVKTTNKALTLQASNYDQFREIIQISNRNMDNYDVVYYALDLTIDFSEQFITASLLMRFMILEDNTSQIDLNFTNTLDVDFITLNGTDLNYSHADDIISVTLSQACNSGDIAEIEIVYSGNPVNRLNDGMKFRTHAGVPVVFTMVSPQGARKWWPCKDTPADKPDSLEIRLTYPEQYVSVANGLRLETVNNGDGTRTDLWLESYPIATYLTSFAITNYEIFTQNYFYQDQEMEILHHVYPEQYDVSVDLYTPTPEMIDFFSAIYGPYPFLTEKYGHASCTDLGALAMEHQTCTSFDAGYITDPEATFTVAHELAHQWAGDFLTIGSWEHVWLKEGFARYSEALWAENLYGYQSLLDYMDALDNGSPLDPPLQRDPEGSGSHIFDIVIYSKGAWTQHMLRGVLQDEDYFAAILNLMSDPQLLYGNFITEDLENAAENTSGMELDWFFDQWFYQEGRPTYNYTLYTASEADSSYITIESLPFQNNYFSMFIPYQYEGVNGRIFVEGGLNHLVLPGSADSHDISMDPDNWVLDYGFTKKLPVLEELEVRDGNVGLAWREFFDPDIDGFNIYRAAEGGEFLKINEEPLTANFYFDENLELGVTYMYKISAVFAGFYESDFSNSIAVEPVEYAFDQGILLVDNSGNFTSPFPTDEEIDSFYHYLLEGLNFTDWDIAASGFPSLDTMAQYSTLIWHSDDILFNPLINNFFVLKNYLTAGGKLFLSNCRSLETLADHELADFLGIDYKSINNNPDFLGAEGLNGYPAIAIDPGKIPLAAWDNAFAYIYQLSPTAMGEAIYSFNSETDDPEWENEPCAVKIAGDTKAITLGFPLYFMEEEAAYDLLQQALADLGEITLSESQEIPEIIEICLKIYPNPFNPSTTISFSLTTEINGLRNTTTWQAEDMEIVIYNLKGQKVKNLSPSMYHTEPVEVGGEKHYNIIWNGTDQNNQPVPSGIYFCKLKIYRQEFSQKMLLLK